jgi:hypothetical protein
MVIQLSLLMTGQYYNISSYASIIVNDAMIEFDKYMTLFLML